MINQAILLASLSALLVAAKPAPAAAPEPEPGPDQWLTASAAFVRGELDRKGRLHNCRVLADGMTFEQAQGLCAQVVVDPERARSAAAGPARRVPYAVGQALVRLVTLPDPVRTAADRMAAGDYRLWRGLAGQQTGVRCALPGGLLDPALDPALRHKGRDAAQEARRHALIGSYIAAYNRAVMTSPGYPYPDICTADPAVPGEGQALLRALAAQRPAVAAPLVKRPDPLWQEDQTFRLFPLEWAILRSDLATAERLLAAMDTANPGADERFGWRSRALDMAIESAQPATVGWVLDHVRPDALRSRRESDFTHPLRLEGQLGADMARRLLGFYLDHPELRPESFLGWSLVTSDRWHVSPGLLTALLTHPRMAAACKAPDGWNPSCDLTTPVLYARSADAALILKLYPPSAQRRAELIHGALERRSEGALALLLAKPYDKAALRRLIAGRPLSEITLRPLPMAAAPIMMPRADRPPPPPRPAAEVEAERIARAQQRAEQEARAAARDARIIDLMVKAGWPRAALAGAQR